MLGIVLAMMCLAAGVTLSTAFREDRAGILRVSFLDVGQGDAILIDSPTGRQVLIDGGPADGGVVRRLGALLAWHDRAIDVVIPTHPDADHIAGLIDVLARYQVGLILRPSVSGETETARALVETLRQEGAAQIVAERGQVIDLGRGAYLEVLTPDRDAARIATNDGCIVTRLVYGDTAFLFPCDAPQAVEKYLVSLDGSALKSDVLKAGHHGSRTSSAPLFVGYVDPVRVVYSRGCDNDFGFPHQETRDTFRRFGIEELDTCTEGTITFESDGRSVRREGESILR